ncbi:hypothetical protein DFH06DRAFT_114659 [Mycena polygramma]|nr:hypothetical protein DFH06DRAFT_114659 [Mycena polygramma]
MYAYRSPSDPECSKRVNEADGHCLGIDVLALVSSSLTCSCSTPSVREDRVHDCALDSAAKSDGHRLGIDVLALSSTSASKRRHEAEESDLSDLSDLSDEPEEFVDQPGEGFHHVLRGDLVRSACDTQSLLPLYIQSRDAEVVGDAMKDLSDLDPIHMEQAYTHLRPRRSARIQSNASKQQSNDMDTALQDPLQSKKKRRRKRARKSETTVTDESETTITDEKTLKWLTPGGDLMVRAQEWQYVPRPDNTGSSNPSSSSQTDLAPPKSTKKKKIVRRAGVAQKIAGGYNPVREMRLAQRTVNRGDTVASLSFSLMHDASYSIAGLQGAAPPGLVRDQIRNTYFEKPNAEALLPWLKMFFGIPYKLESDPRKERGTFVVDKAGLIFFYRSFRAMWLANRVDEIEEAQNVLVGQDLLSPTIRNSYADGLRGPHMAIILGHQRQSATKPKLTAWHVEHQDRVEKFMDLSVVKHIIKWVTSVIRTVWPGLAARVEEEAEWHFQKHGIRPLFGLFWNLCWNAAFPGQERIHTPPHADCKNQVGICAILVYILKCGLKFNHKMRSWLVLWEAGIYAELPPWVLAGYPSALFYHFNVDVHKLQYVWTGPDVERPTPENSHPIVPGDETGRGSIVFFSQATMRNGPLTGYDTLKAAREAGVDTSIDLESDIQTAFRNALVLQPIPQEIIDKIGDTIPTASDFNL